MARIAQADYWFFLRVVLQYEWMDPFLHGEVIASFLDEDFPAPKLVLLPRGCGKTGMITQPRPAWHLARNPLGTCCVNNAAEDKAGKMARTSAGIVTTNDRYRSCFSEIIPSKKWGEAGYYLDANTLSGGEGSVERVDPSIGSYGVGGNITGSHFSALMINDDLINREVAKSKTRMADVDAFYAESLNCLDPGAEQITCGTRWDYLDFYGRLISGELEGSEGRVKVLKLGVTNDAGELIWPQKTYVDMMGNKRTAGYTEQKIESAKKANGPLFSALYYNEPLLERDVKFNIEAIKFFSKLPFRTSGVHGVFIEAESQASALVSAVHKMARDELRKTKIVGITSKRTGKKERILSALQPLIEAGRFNMREIDWRSEDSLGAEIRSYDKGHDDAIDATAYCSKLAKEPPAGGTPQVWIIVDPAFTVETYSDYTAIVAGCYFAGEFWVLKVVKFQTEKVDTIGRRIFRVVDEFSAGQQSGGKELGLNVTGFGNKSKRNKRNDSDWDIEDSFLEVN